MVIIYIKDYERIMNSILYKPNGRSHKEALELKYILEYGLILKPTVFMTTSFRYNTKISIATDRIGAMIHQFATRELKTHVLPIVVYNHDRFIGDYGKVRNDIHLLLLTNNEASYDVQKIKDYLKSDKNKYFGRSEPLSKILEYDGNRDGVQYMTLRHKELGIVMGCPQKKSSCGRGKCPYKIDMSRLLNEVGRNMVAGLLSRPQNNHIKAYK
tara:strand:- start:2384 stop:3022 length:639 start_codon:yes stop_codon:yes gene_type:complete